MQDKKQEVKRILSVAFTDIDTLSFHGRESWATEKDEIYNNSKVCLLEPPIPYDYQRISDDTTADPIDSTIEWIIRDINNLDKETLYVINRFFEAFSSITERDLKWIDYLDGLDQNETLPSMKKFQGILSKKTFAVNGKLILDNMNDKVLEQWLELLSRKNYKDNTRKLGNEQIESLKTDIQRNLYAHKNSLGLEGLISFLNFVQYLIEKQEGSFFRHDIKYWKMFLSIKYWFSHFWDESEIISNVFTS